VNDLTLDELLRLLGERDVVIYRLQMRLAELEAEREKPKAN
jgi:hypothetical protein